MAIAVPCNLGCVLSQSCTYYYGQQKKTLQTHHRTRCKDKHIHFDNVLYLLRFFFIKSTNDNSVPQRVDLCPTYVHYSGQPRVQGLRCVVMPITQCVRFYAIEEKKNNYSIGIQKHDG